MKGERYNTTARKWYNLKRWKDLRLRQLAKQPMCECPHCQGKDMKAEVVDHIEPHRGDSRLFWNPANLQSMAKLCHDKHKQSQEKGGHGFNVGCDESGLPLSKDHHWNE